MPEQKGERGSSLLGNPSALLALVTIVGGLWLVSQKLTSDRPVTPAGGAEKIFIGDQKLEARLWEDPFKHFSGERNHPGEGGETSAVGLNMLAEQIRRRSETGATPADAANVSSAPRVVLMPVMIAGGQYSEDKESRIRSRFAVVSALGRAGYAPEDAERIGELRVPWLTQHEVDQAKRKPSRGSPEITRLWDQEGRDSPDAKARLLGIAITAQSAKMEVRYEWYRSRVFSAGTGSSDSRPAVLVLWLDGGYFEDNPLLRLPLLLERLTDPGSLPPGRPSPRVVLVGPRRSSTLRAMLPDWRTGRQPLDGIANPSLKPLVQKVLNRIEIFCATPSAMDEVLVKDPLTPDRTPRASVRARLREAGFKAFNNFAATDAQMAHEIIDELALRGADLTDERNHVVLISEWDTFYARMLSLTYGAELAVRQQKDGPRPLRSRADFINAYNSPPDPKMPALGFPENFRSFVYLRGLDGQTVDMAASASEDAGDGRTGKGMPTSVEELRHWAPDVNKAEGQAQFDYLGRLGDRLEEVQKSLNNENRGQIKAIGIVGSDVYDTLLILQALRERFPAVLFFTTDLDVRFFHPRERDWARNLIVASSYGLTLHPSLQETVTPFRDSAQTAQFAAVLAALGDNRLEGIVRVPARRFEIGNRTAVDLSVESGALVSTVARQAGKKEPAWLHPLTASERDWWYSFHDLRPLWWSLVAVFLLLAGACRGWDPLRRVTWDGMANARKALDFTEEDVGGPDGVAALLRGFDRRPNDEIAQWLFKQPELRESRGHLDEKPAGKTGEFSWERENELNALTIQLVVLLNRLLHREKGPDGSAPPAIPRKAGEKEDWMKRVGRRLPVISRLQGYYDARRGLDAYLDAVVPAKVVKEKAPLQPNTDNLPGLGGKISRQCKHMHHEATRALDSLFGDPELPRSTFEEKPADFEGAALEGAAAARESAERLFRLCCRQLIFFWVFVIAMGLLGGGLIQMAWNDTFKFPEGEPFSLTSGTSAWPAEAVRLLVFALAVCFSFGLSHKMREAFLSLTRSFRFSLPATDSGKPPDRTCAQFIWDDYRRRSAFRRRLQRIGWVIPFYLLLLFAIMGAFGEAVFSPVRGDVVGGLNRALLWASFLGFLVLALLTVDAARLCRGFIEDLSGRTTHYPGATRRYFSRQKGWIDMEYLDEWIDLQLIAELTEKVGRLVYYPAGLVLLMVLARNSWWDNWSWPVSLIVVFACNFTLALASVVILQSAARAAKRRAEASLAAKVKNLQAQSAPTAIQNNATQAEKLLEEIRGLNRGAFVPFWENPVVGAVFLSSGGTTMLQLFIWFLGR